MTQDNLNNIDKTQSDDIAQNLYQKRTNDTNYNSNDHFISLGLAIASWIPFINLFNLFFIYNIVSIIFAIKALKQKNKNTQIIIISIISLILNIILILFTIIFLGTILYYFMDTTNTIYNG